MDLRERTYSVLIVSASEKFNDSLLELFPNYRYNKVKITSNVSMAKRELTERNYDFILINSPLPDEDGIRFAVDTCLGSNNVVAVMVRAEIYPQITEKLTLSGVYIIQKPMSKQGMIKRLEWMETTKERLKKIEKKTLSLEDRMRQIRTINRAKWLLIENNKMTEEDAHHFIEKQAMDKCVSKEQIAEDIINTYKI